MVASDRPQYPITDLADRRPAHRHPRTHDVHQEAEGPPTLGMVPVGIAGALAACVLVGLGL
jgi:hypothetical protein